MEAKKVIVAVHGIGDQSQFATIQQVLAQFSRYYGQTAAVPLGNFHNGSKAGVFISDDPPDMSGFGFAEVYWADIPRQVVEKKYLLEDIQPWVRTIIGRVHRRRLNDLTEADVRMIEQVLGEMLQTIDVLERLCFLAAKMGIFSFDLRKVLIDFLDDVQIVAEFKEQGGEIGKVFAKKMQDLNDELANVEEIYIVAHSEGTVVALLGLLTAMCTPGNPWISKVRGLMTIGSPIDKHLILWPELFANFKTACTLPRQPIEWHNYYDYGDPVGFELETARKRFTDGPWKDAFYFPATNDHGFARYPLPGKAHNDYWQDEGVFGHFIRNVVAKEAPPPPKPVAVKHQEPPKSKALARIVSWVVPYLGAAALLFCGVLVLYKAVWGFLNPNGPPEELLTVFSHVAAISCLLAGITVVARIQRLTRFWRWRLFGVLVFLLFVAGYRSFSCLADGSGFGSCFTTMPAGSDSRLVWIALALVLAVSVVSRLRPAWGMRTLLIPGSIAVAYVVYGHVHGTQGNLWPVFLAGAVFLYLWWLVALLFDLTFVWHRYIRMSVPIFTAQAATSGQSIAPAPLSGRQGALRTP
jgi:hypothetical protein